MADIKDQLIKDSYNYVLQSDLSTGVVYRIGGSIPINPIFSSGLTINSGFTYSNGTEQPGYALLTDGTGYAYWGPVSGASPSSGVTGNGTTNYLPKWTGSTGLGDSLIYDNGTNVGIGTSSPTTKLEVSGTVLSTDFIATNSGQANNIFPKDDVDLNLSTRTNTGTKSINLRTGTGSGGLGDIQLSINSSGYVGIGTSSPSAKLDINVSTGGTIGVRMSGDSSSDMLRITQTGSGNALVVEDSGNPDSTPFTITSDGKVYIGTTDSTTSILNVGGNSHFYGNIFLNGTTNRAIQNSTSGRALINFATAGDSYFNNGNLGIGTISPGSKLDINASTGSTIGLRVSGGSSVDMVRITQTGSGNAIVVEDDVNPDSTPFVVAADGRVGIGVTAPLSSYKLHVRNGTATNSAAASGTVAVFENSGTSYVTVLSTDSTNSGFSFGSDSDRFGAFVAWNYDSSRLSINTDKVGGYISFSTDDQIESVRIDSSGNTGINVTSPSEKLHVSGNTLIQGSLTATTKTTIGSESNISSALLQMASTTQGVLFPRMTNTQRESIVSPVPGLFVYCTDSPEGLFMYKSTGWVQIM